MIEDKIEKLIHQALSELEYTDCFLVHLKIKNTRVEIFLDSDQSVTFEKCRKVSRKIEAVLDEKQWLGEKYTLNVSSAGVGMPLKLTRQYIKNIGRTIEIKKVEGAQLEGKLIEADEEKVKISFEEIIKEGKKKKKIETIVEIQRADIKESKIKVSF